MTVETTTRSGHDAAAEIDGAWLRFWMYDGTSSGSETRISLTKAKQFLTDTLAMLNAVEEFPNPAGSYHSIYGDRKYADDREASKLAAE